MNVQNFLMRFCFVTVTGMTEKTRKMNIGRLVYGIKNFFNRDDVIRLQACAMVSVINLNKDVNRIPKLIG
jgi:hypothetical protein